MRVLFFEAGVGSLVVNALGCDVFDGARKCIVIYRRRNKAREPTYMGGEVRAEPVFGTIRTDFGNGFEGFLEFHNCLSNLGRAE